MSSNDGGKKYKKDSADKKDNTPKASGSEPILLHFGTKESGHSSNRD